MLFRLFTAAGLVLGITSTALAFPPPVTSWFDQNSSRLLLFSPSLPEKVVSTVESQPTTSEYPRYPLMAVAPITSHYGPRWGRLHAGIDLGIPVGTPVVASLSGKVIIAGWLDGYGNTIVIRQPDGKTETYYAHLSSFQVKVGEFVKQGQRIAKSGNSGRSTGAHLHFEIRHQVKGKWLPININQVVVYAQSLLGS